MRDHPIECAQPFFPLGDVLVGEQQKVGHRRLLDDCHCAIESGPARHQLGLLARLGNRLDGSGKELEQNPAEEFILLEDLVGVEALPVP